MPCTPSFHYASEVLHTETIMGLSGSDRLAFLPVSALMRRPTETMHAGCALIQRGRQDNFVAENKDFAGGFYRPSSCR